MSAATTVETPEQVMTATAPEDLVGVWRGSKANFSFWFKTLITLSLYYWLVYIHNDITLTTRRVTQRRGDFLNSNQNTIVLDSITDVDVKMAMLGELFNYGDVAILTSGSRMSEIQFPRLANPKALREAIFDLRDGRLDETNLEKITP